MKKIHKILIFIILILMIIFQTYLKDSYNSFIGLFKKEEKLVMNDEMISVYINGLEKEIANFKSIKSIKDCQNARIIYRNPNYWYDTFVINKGALDGINENDIVINESGLIGIVTKIYNNSSDISLLTNTDKNKAITVGITNNKETIYGIIRKYNKLKNELIIEELTSNIEGDLNVVTTSFTQIFKENILIAKVKEVKNSKDGLSKYAVATPIVDYNNLNYVCVIENDNL